MQQSCNCTLIWFCRRSVIIKSTKPCIIAISHFWQKYTWTITKVSNKIRIIIRIEFLFFFFCISSSPSIDQAYSIVIVIVGLKLIKYREVHCTRDRKKGKKTEFIVSHCGMIKQRLAEHWPFEHKKRMSKNWLVYNNLKVIILWNNSMKSKREKDRKIVCKREAPCSLVYDEGSALAFT